MGALTLPSQLFLLVVSTQPLVSSAGIWESVPSAVAARNDIVAEEHAIGWLLASEQTTQHICGDGLLSTNETCDDDNTIADDGCDEQCQRKALAGMQIS